MADAGEVRARRAAAAGAALRAPRAAPESAAALTLRLVLGVPTADIARLFLVPVPTMAARLTRARKRLATERFELPEGPIREPRRARRRHRLPGLHGRLRPASGAEVVRADLAGEAVRLVRLSGS